MAPWPRLGTFNRTEEVRLLRSVRSEATTDASCPAASAPLCPVNDGGEWISSILPRFPDKSNGHQFSGSMGMSGGRLVLFITACPTTLAVRRRVSVRPLGMVLLAALAASGSLFADPPPATVLPAPRRQDACPVPLPCPDPCLPDCPRPLSRVTLTPPRPCVGKGSLNEFVESVTGNDATLDVIAGQGRILTTRKLLSVAGKPPALVAVGDPTVLDVVILNTRQIRLVGHRIGVTDLAITTPDNQTLSLEVRVLADLTLLRQQLSCSFPDASVRLAQMRDHIVVSGEVRDGAQATRVLETIRAYLLSIQGGQLQQTAAQQQQPRFVGPQPEQPPPGVGAPPGVVVGGESAGVRSARAVVVPPQIINLLKIPGPRQVLLKVRIAELNRDGFRQIGAGLLGYPGGKSILGTQIPGGTTGSAVATATEGALTGLATLLNTPGATTVFGIFERGKLAIMLNALKRNNLLKILAEPNLVALDGQAADFLAGGEFPVPVPQTAGGIGTSPAITVQFKQFGVRLGFLPFILDGDTIRLQVDPEVSNLDFTFATTLVAGGSPVPGLDTRKAHTVVELKEGQTLAIAGLLQLTLNATTTRIPGLGDLPILGPFFSNTTGERTEKELLVLVTPYLIEPMGHKEVPPVPGDEVNEPNQLEFYFLDRIESRTGRDFRSTVNYEWRLPYLRWLLKLEKDSVAGPHGFGD